jgi:hypothetical protein
MTSLQAGTTWVREVLMMRLLRALLGSLLWILAGVVGLLGVLLCITVILLPLGVPLLFLARKLFAYSMTFFLPRTMRHPARELGRKSRQAGEKAARTGRRTGRKVTGGAAEKLGRQDRSLTGRLKRAL